jgi:hypothetical protein
MVLFPDSLPSRLIGQISTIDNLGARSMSMWGRAGALVYSIRLYVAGR